MPPPQSKTSVPPIPPPPPPPRYKISPLPPPPPPPPSPIIIGKTHWVVVKPFHWSKFACVVKGSVWDDIQLHDDNQSWINEVDVSELKSLFSTLSTTPPSPPQYKTFAPPTRPLSPPRSCSFPSCFSLPISSLFVVDRGVRRTFSCEILLTRIKIPLPDMLSAVLALDSSAVDIDQVENLIKLCQTKEEMEMLRNYTSDKEMLGKCEQFFMELMKVPRIEAKLRVFGFKITFASQVEEFKGCLNIINAATKEVKESTKLRQILQTILVLGNALNQGTEIGDAVGFRLESLLTLSDTRTDNNQMNLMHYLYKLLGEKKPELLDFAKDLVHLEAASKIALRTLAEEIQALIKGVFNVQQELMTSENDGEISVGFRKVLKDFHDSAQAEVTSLIPLYSEVDKNADSLSQYFGEDPVRCPFKQVTKILTLFTTTFIKSREENEKLAEVEKKKLEKEAMKYTPVLKKDIADSDNKAYLPDSLSQNMNKTELL